MLNKFWLIALIALTAIPAAKSTAQNCDVPVPIPTGTSSKPAEFYDASEYQHIKGSLPLQGNRAGQKYAPLLFSSTFGGYGNFQTSVVVNNPSSTGQLVVDIEYFRSASITANPADNLIPVLANYGVVIDPNGKYQELPWQFEGFDACGVVCVTVADTSEVPDFVGCTVYQADEIVHPINSDLGTITTDEPLATMQPLQQVQSNRMAIGPIPARLSTSKDMLNGLFSVIHIANPNAQTLNFYALIESTNGTTNLVGPVSIDPMGMTKLYDVWVMAADIYSLGLPEDDFTVTLVADRRFIAETLLFDFLVGDSGGGGGGGGERSSSRKDDDIPDAGTGTRVHHFGENMRATSFIPAVTPDNDLVSPDLTVDIGSATDTTISLVNVSPTNTGPVRVEYFDRDGILLGSDSIGSMPKSQAVYLGWGLPASPNFPTTSFQGWARIVSCHGFLIGYTNRANDANASNKKMCGELLHGNGGVEHGIGWTEFGRRHIMAPLVFQNDLAAIESNYVTFVNDNTSNLQAYGVRAFDPMGMASGLIGFIGLRAGDTSGTYFDAWVTNPGFMPHSALVSVLRGHVKGNNVIGGSLIGRLFFEIPFYAGPGDTVPW